MTGAGGAFVLSGVQLVAGTFLMMFATMLVFRSISRGYFRSTVWVLAPLMAAVSFGASGGLQAWGLVTSAGMALFLAAVYSQRPLLEWGSGAATCGLALGMLIAMGTSSCADAPCAVAVANALLGALFLGAVTHGMTLGHWYLNQPRLPIEPLKAGAVVMLAVMPLVALFGAVTRAWLVSGPPPGGFLLFTREAFWWSWLLLLVGTAVVAVMVRSTVWERSTQSATGLMYVAMVPAIGAQFLLTLLVIT